MLVWILEDFMGRVWGVAALKGHRSHPEISDSRMYCLTGAGRTTRVKDVGSSSSWDCPEKCCRRKVLSAGMQLDRCRRAELEVQRT